MMSDVNSIITKRSSTYSLSDEKFDVILTFKVFFVLMFID